MERWHTDANKPGTFGYVICAPSQSHGRGFSLKKRPGHGCRLAIFEDFGQQVWADPTSGRVYHSWAGRHALSAPRDCGVITLPYLF